VELIFELSEKGRKGYRLPELDVPAVDEAEANRKPILKASLA
jgi:hypothetical protein